MADLAATRAGHGGRIKVLLVHRRRLLAEALGTVLGADPDLEVISVLTDPCMIVDHVDTTQPDVVVLGSSLTPLEPAEATAALRARHPELKVIVLPSIFSADDLSACLQAGAVAYLSKDCSPGELIHSVKRVHAGEVLFPHGGLMSLLTRPERRADAPSLAPRELEVLLTLATGRSIDEAAARLGITVHTVRTHLRNAMTKLRAHSRLEAIIIALKEGLIQLPE